MMAEANSKPNRLLTQGANGSLHLLGDVNHRRLCF
jgi:hypothetical protein